MDFVTRQHITDIYHARTSVLGVPTVGVARQQLGELIESLTHTTDVALGVVTGDERGEEVLVHVIR